MVRSYLGEIEKNRERTVWYQIFSLDKCRKSDLKIKQDANFGTCQEACLIGCS
jgi:hypothetical protein